MTFTRGIGVVCGSIVDRIVRWLALSKIHPNVLTFLGLVINIWAAWLFSRGSFKWAGAVVIGAGLFDMVDGRVARATQQVTRFGAQGLLGALQAGGCRHGCHARDRR